MNNESMSQDVYMNQNESNNHNESTTNESPSECQQQNDSVPIHYNHSGHKRHRQSNNSNQSNNNNSNNNNKHPKEANTQKHSRLHSGVVDRFLKAAENGDYRTVVHMLIHKEIVGNETNQRQQSAFYLAIRKMRCYGVTPDVVRNLFRIMNILLDYQPNLLNQRDNVGITPLFLAMLSRNLQPALFLLERGADETIPRPVGFDLETPLQWLIRVGHYPPALVSLFERARSIRNIAKLKRGFPRLREAIRLRRHKRLVVKLALDAASSTYIPEVLIDIMMEYVPLLENTEK